MEKKLSICPLVRQIRGQGMDNKRKKHCTDCIAPICWEDITGANKEQQFVSSIERQIEKLQCLRDLFKELIK